MTAKQIATITATVTALLITIPTIVVGTMPGELHELRVRKCGLIVDRLYPNSGFGEYVDFFITEHERRGMGGEWWWSLAYGGANCGLVCGRRFPNGCTGPMDRPNGPLDPRRNIEAHCLEWLRYHRRGIIGYDAARHVFYPARPHDWRGSEYRRMIKGHHLEHQQIIDNAYKRGDLP